MCWWIGLLDSFQRSHACVCCRSPIVLPLSCPRPVHVHQSGCSLIHRTALWKTSLLRKKGSTQLKTMRWAELYERDMRQQGSPLSVPGTPGTSQIHPSKGEVETQITSKELGGNTRRTLCEKETAFECPRHPSTSTLQGRS